MDYVYTVLATTAAIIAAQSIFKYTLNLAFIFGGIKSLFLHLFGKKPLK